MKVEFSLRRALLALLVVSTLLLGWRLPAQATTLSSALLISDVRLLDLSGPAPVVTSRTSVLIEDGTIVAVAQAEALDAPEGATVVDGRGRILMPGLVDMHVHVWDQAELGAYLAYGVTTVRNASGMPFHLRLAEQISAGRLAGPRLVTTGPILNSPGPNAQINHQIVETDEQARAAVRAQHAAGFRRLKLYSNLTREAYEAARDEARRLGMTIMGHSPEGPREPGMPRDKPFVIAFEDLLDDGFVTFEHMESIVWHGLRDRHDEAAARRLAQQVAAAGVAVDPTLLAFYNLLRVAETRGQHLERAGVEMLNPAVVAQEKANYERWSREAVGPNRAAFEFYKRSTRIFADAGVVLVAGSDAGIFTNIPGESLIDELELLVEAGLSPFEALRAATCNPARVLGEGGRAGRVAPGHRADLILLDTNPLDDVRAAGRPAAVIAGGRLYDRTALEKLTATARAPNVERTMRNVFEGLRAQGVDPAPLLQ